MVYVLREEKQKCMFAQAVAEIADITITENPCSGFHSQRMNMARKCSSSFWLVSFSSWSSHRFRIPMAWFHSVTQHELMSQRAPAASQNTSYPTCSALGRVQDPLPSLTVVHWKMECGVAWDTASAFSPLRVALCVVNWSFGTVSWVEQSSRM